MVIPYNENSNLKYLIFNIKSFKVLKNINLGYLKDDGSTDNGGLVVKISLKKQNIEFYFK